MFRDSDDRENELERELEKQQHRAQLIAARATAFRKLRQRFVMTALGVGALAHQHLNGPAIHVTTMNLRDRRVRLPVAQRQLAGRLLATVREDHRPVQIDGQAGPLGKRLTEDNRRKKDPTD